MSQLKRRALQATCMVGVILGACGCVAHDRTASAPANGDGDPRMVAPRTLSMGAGDSIGQTMFSRSAQQVATIEDGGQ